jgi:type 1 fimbriae regulatory protein FimB
MTTYTTISFDTIFAKKFIFIINKNQELLLAFEKMTTGQKNKLITALEKKYINTKGLNKINLEWVDKRIKQIAKKYDPQESIKFLNSNQLNDLFATIKKGGNVRDFTMFRLMYFYALRVTELCNLTVNDIDMLNYQITIKGLKGGLKQTTDLDKHSIKLLNDYLPERVESWSDCLFLSRNGGPLSRIDIYRIFKKYSKQAGLKEDLQHPHALRHSTASTLANSDVPVEKAQRQLRHKNIANTMIYYNLTGSKLTEIVNSNISVLAGED